MAFVRTARTPKEIEDILTTQKELFNQLKNRGGASKSDEPLPPFIKFNAMGDVIQGVVVDTYVTKAWDPVNKAAQKDKNGDEIPQLNVTLQMEAGVFRQSFQGDLLWKLGAALSDLGLDELPKGAIVASKWESMFEKNGVKTRAREHAVIVKVP